MHDVPRTRRGETCCDSFNCGETRSCKRTRVRLLARGDARPDSDLDLLLTAGPRTSPWFPGGLLVDLEDELARSVDVVEEKAIHPLIRDRARGRAPVKDDWLYVRHVLECIERIQRYCQKGREEFAHSELVQEAVLRNLQVLAESTERMSDGLKAKHPEAQWRAGFRNVLVHDYLGVNLGRTWEIVSTDIPVLQVQMDEIRTELEPPGIG